MTFKVLIIEDNHSFIDSLKVMLRDLPLDFGHAFRYSDAQIFIEKSGIFYNRQNIADPATAAAEQVEAIINAASVGKKRHTAQAAKLYNEGGVFLIIVEQNTESSMKGTDFIAHATRKFPALSEGDFVLLTHRLELVPAKNHNFPVLEKPLRAPQIRQLVQQKLKQAQDLVDMQARVAAQKIDKTEKQAPAEAAPKTPRKGLRELLKMTRKPEAKKEPKIEEKKTTAKKKKSSAAVQKVAKPPRKKGK